MDILELVDRLEELLQEGRSIPLIRGLLVDEERLWELIDQMRVSIPEEVRKAQQLLHQKNSIIESAQKDADRIRKQAEAERARLVEESAIVQAAQARAEEILAEAEAEAQRIRAEAEAFAREIFLMANQHLHEALKRIQRGLRILEETSSSLPVPQNEAES